VNTSLKGYDEILITGGEPMLFPHKIIEVCTQVIDEYTSLTKVGLPVTLCPPSIFLYTAKARPALNLIAMLHWVDGITLTLHEQEDVKDFKELQKFIRPIFGQKKFLSLRLNVFSHVDITGVDITGWSVKKDMVWEKDCPLPDDETFCRWESSHELET
jgi:hypothetical protein